MPITSDFVVQLLGVVGGRVSPETFINSALPQLTGPVASAISQQLGVPQDQVAEKIQQGQELLRPGPAARQARSEEHTSELQSRFDLVCRLLLEQKKNPITN